MLFFLKKHKFQVLLAIPIGFLLSFTLEASGAAALLNPPKISWSSAHRHETMSTITKKKKKTKNAKESTGIVAKATIKINPKTKKVKKVPLLFVAVPLV